MSFCLFQTINYIYLSINLKSATIRIYLKVHAKGGLSIKITLSDTMLNINTGYNIGVSDGYAIVDIV